MSDHGTHTIEREDAVLVLIDVQDRLAAAMPRRAEVVASARFLLRTAELLGIPRIVTRQYPRGLGPVVPELADLLAEAAIDKLAFDCTAEKGFTDALEHTRKRQVVVAGMETHICVAQTTLSLLDRGYRVHVVADAVCSRRDSDNDIALERMRAAGAEVTTAEAVLYEALRVAGTADFRAALELVKERGTGS
ncbi:MAG: hydrolase [Actinomycetia bacterium]|nr:hydrolase [Actinomycetes bacterium]